MNDLDYMARALDLAERGRGSTSPNPMVGAVVVQQDGTIVGQGYHERAGGPHAEVRALDEAGDRARGAVLYCTLEPCAHVGRTGPCVERVVAAGIRRVVAATTDVDPRVSGRGFAFLRQEGVDVVVGPGRARALRLNRPYFTYQTKGRPFVIMKIATSRDNRISEAPGRRTAITSEAARRHAQGVRGEVDAIGVGSGTLLVDDPLLTVRGLSRSRPLVRVIFDRRLRSPASARVFSTLDAGPVIIVTSLRSVEADPGRVARLRDAGAQVEPVASAELPEALRLLFERQIVSLLLEGGAVLHAAAWQAGVVDAIHQYVSPDELGPAGVPWLDAAGLAAAERREMTLGSDRFIESHVHGID